MNDITTLIERVGAPDAGAAELKALLDLSTTEEIQALHAAAYQVKLAHVGAVCHFRGIVEFSNICSKDCLYCGIRRSNSAVKRFTMEAQEILDAAKWAYEAEYGSMVLQSGERQDPAFIDFVEKLLQEIHTLSNGKLGITLSLGEQTPETYRRWFEAGAHRYLLRIETSRPAPPRRPPLPGTPRQPARLARHRLPDRHRRDDRPARSDHRRPGQRHPLLP